MKHPILFVPSLLVFGCALLLAKLGSAPLPDASARSGQQVQILRQQVQQLSARLDELAATSHHVLPRGGLSSSSQPITHN